MQSTAPNSPMLSWLRNARDFGGELCAPPGRAVYHYCRGRAHRPGPIYNHTSSRQHNRIRTNRIDCGSPCCSSTRSGPSAFSVIMGRLRRSQPLPPQRRSPSTGSNSLPGNGGVAPILDPSCARYGIGRFDPSGHSVRRINRKPCRPWTFQNVGTLCLAAWTHREILRERNAPPQILSHFI